MRTDRLTNTLLPILSMELSNHASQFLVASGKSISLLVKLWLCEVKWDKKIILKYYNRIIQKKGI